MIGVFMLVSFHMDPDGQLVGSGYHEREELVKGRRVRFEHFNYEIDRVDGELGGVLYVTVRDERGNLTNMPPKTKWRGSQAKKAPSA